MNNPIGAHITYNWSDNSVNHYGYVSFGEYDVEIDEDGFGVPDANIFFYFEDVVDMQAYKDGAFDFDVLDYELIYQEEEA